MHHRGWQAGVAIVTARKEIETLSRNPLLDASAELLFPRKRSVRLSLVRAIHSQGVMHGGTSVAIPFRDLADVLVSARVDEQRLPATLQAYTQRIGVRMAVALRNRGPTGDHQLPRAGRRSVHARTLHGRRSQHRRLRFDKIPLLDSSLSQKPNRLLA